MAWVIYLATAVAVFVIAAVSIGREARRLDSISPAPAFELGEAVEQIADGLPADITAELSYDDVRSIVTWHLESLEAAGLEQRFGGNDQLIIVDAATDRDDAAAAEILQLSQAHDKNYTIQQIKAVLAGEFRYLAQIGAVGPLADPEREL